MNKQTKSTVYLIIAGIFILGGIAASLPALVMWDSIKIQVGLGNYDLMTKFGPMALGGLLSLGVGWIFLGKSK